MKTPVYSHTGFVCKNLYIAAIRTSHLALRPLKMIRVIDCILGNTGFHLIFCCLWETQRHRSTSLIRNYVLDSFNLGFIPFKLDYLKISPSSRSPRIGSSHTSTRWSTSITFTSFTDGSAKIHDDVAAWALVVVSGDQPHTEPDALRYHGWLSGPVITDPSHPHYIGGDKKDSTTSEASALFWAHLFGFLKDEAYQLKWLWISARRVVDSNCVPPSQDGSMMLAHRNAYRNYSGQLPWTPLPQTDAPTSVDLQPACNLFSFNVRTLKDPTMESQQTEGVIGKQILLETQLDTLDIAIAGLQETRSFSSDTTATARYHKILLAPLRAAILIQGSKTEGEQQGSTNRTLHKEARIHILIHI